MTRNYDIIMHVPLGNRKGTLMFAQENGKIDGVLHVFGRDHPLSGTMTDQGMLKFSGQITSILCTFSYEAEGEITNGKLKLTAVGERYQFTITGKEAGTGAQ